MPRTRFIPLFLLVFSALAQVRDFDKGLAFYRVGRHREAIQAFSAARKGGEKNSLLDFYEGVCFAKIGTLQAAAPLLTRYVAVQPGDSHGWYWLGRVELLQKRFLEARDAIQHAVILDPNASESFRTLGEAELELGHNDAAYRAWITANKLNPSDAETTYHLGRLFFEADMFSEAAVWLRETLRLTPVHFRATTYLGLCAEHLGDSKTARSLYLQAIEQSTQQKTPYAWAYVSYAKLLRETGEDREALAILEESERLCPNPNALSLLGQMLAAEHQSERAKLVLRRAIQMDPELPDPHYRLSLALRAEGDFDNARAEMTRFEQTKRAEEQTRNRIMATQTAEQKLK